MLPLGGCSSSSKGKISIEVGEGNILEFAKDEMKAVASDYMKSSIDSFALYASSYHKVYKPMWLTWTGNNDMNHYLELAKADQATAEKWSRRSLQ